MTEYSDFVRQYLTVAIFAGVGLGLGAGLLALGGILRPKRPQEQKYLVYESGVDPVGTGWSQSQIRYYVYALLFVMFDVEAVFIFPWATQLEVYGVFGLVEMLIFVAILAIGLLYAWRKKVLTWAS
ncbi:MAG: NADH-quinone oxidoreductase subunit A [Acidimicrobiia bacterium]|jgi:NADH-quinone oxidoreductase subunit A|nr:NADH-quinone oxidoreductase subunit A [Acidimicrobiia bacterium]